MNPAQFIDEGAVKIARVALVCILVISHHNFFHLINSFGRIGNAIARGHNRTEGRTCKSTINILLFAVCVKHSTITFHPQIATSKNSGDVSEGRLEEVRK
jgi:hypothetical protein